MNGDGSWLEAGEIVCHCLYVEVGDRRVLVDTGIGRADIRRPSRLGRTFGLASRPRYDDTETAVAQLEAAGVDAKSVTDVVCTHLDLDHAGGIADFPAATVHVAAAEWDAFLGQRPPRLAQRGRYLPAHRAALRDRRVEVYDDRAWEAWHGLSAQPLRIAPELALVDLPGHTPGHAGIAVPVGGRTRLHCGDAYMHRGTVRPHEARVPVGVRVFQGQMAWHPDRFAATQDALRTLAARPDGIDLFSAHDPIELRAFRTTAPATESP